MLLYLEADDEITTVVRRLRESDADNIVLVAPGRAKALTSSVALRLLARLAADEGRTVALVADATTRSLASEAGIASYASVADAEQGVSAAVAPTTRAQIHVVQGDEPTAALTAPARSMRTDETRAVRTAVAPAGTRRRVWPWLAVVSALALLLGTGAAAAIVAPAATIRLAPKAEAIGPLSYALDLVPDRLNGTLQSTATGRATGTYTDRVAARGVVVFQNFSGSAIDVPAGTQVAAGEIVFASTEAVTVRRSTVLPSGAIQSGDQAAAVVAISPGPAGNVPAGSINRVVDPQLDARLQDHPDIGQPRVTNSEATAGGSQASGPQIKKDDVDAATAALRMDLDAQLAKALGDQSGRIGPSGAAPTAVITVPAGLVGARNKPTFELSGSLAYDHRSVQVAAVTAAAEERLASDPALRQGTSLVPGSVAVTPGDVALVGARLRVQARVAAQAAPALDPATVRAQVAGLSADAARSTLARYGSVDLQLWPGWVKTVPSLEWRIDVVIDPGRAR